MFQNLKFSHKILLAASAIVISTFTLFSLYNDSLQRQVIHDDLESYLKDMGTTTASNIQSWLSGRILLVESVAQSIATDNSQERLEKLLEQPVMGSTFMFTYLGAEDGKMTMRPEEELPADYDPRIRPWYKDAMQAGSTTLTEPYVDASTKQLIITIASPVRGAGVVGGDLSLQTLVQAINALDFGGTGYAFLVSADGTILVHPDQERVMQKLGDLFPQNTPRIDGDLTEAAERDSQRIVTFAPVQGLPTVKWYVGLSIDKDKAYAMLGQLPRLGADCHPDCRGSDHRPARHAYPHPDETPAQPQSRHAEHCRR